MMHHYLKKLDYFKTIGHWLLPYSCILCNNKSARSQDICENCLDDLPFLTFTCHRCAKPLLQNNPNLICSDCLSQPPPFNRTFALFYYQPPITKLIMNLKFGQSLVNARILGELLAEKIQFNWYKGKPLPEVLIPIPLHHQRLKERGFNQAVEIARPVAKKLDLPIELFICQRIKNTAPQARLPAHQREQNIQDAFRVLGKLDFQHVAILDDVMTTGFTVKQFSSILRRGGIKQIDVWCCARPKR